MLCRKRAVKQLTSGIKLIIQFFTNVEKCGSNDAVKNISSLPTQMSLKKNINLKLDSKI